MLTLEYRIVESSRIAGLYDIAKEKAWNAGKDLPWNSLATACASPIVADCSPFCGFEAYERLPETSRALANRKWQQGGRDD